MDSLSPNHDPLPINPKRAALPPEKLQKVLAYIDEHLEERLPIARLAGVVNMSPFHFARLFKQATGHAPHAYLLARRVDRAKQLLSEQALPLVRVATSVGFQTQGHFTEVFRRFSGLTPRHYRLAAKAQAGQAGATFQPAQTPAS